MAEQLLIRLNSQAQQPISWLIWSSNENDIIASGELANAQALTQLQEKSVGRQVIALVPSSDVALKQLNVPGKSTKAIQAAAPYMLEDDLAQEVETLFFAYADRAHAEYNCFIALTDHEKMSQWLNWLTDAGIATTVMLPEVLALPNNPEQWQAIELAGEVIVRQGGWQGFSADIELLPTLSQHWQDDEIVIASYSELPVLNEKVEVIAQPEELPLALYAQYWQQAKFNLLQGEFKPKNKRSPLLKTWGLAAGLAIAALLLNLLGKGLTIWQLNDQQEAIDSQIVVQYKQAFPETKRVRVSTVRSQLKRKLAQLGSGSQQADFFILLNKIQPAFSQVPNLKPQSLKYDSKRNEVRMQATGKGYQDFEKFSSLLQAANLTVNQGAQNNQGDSIVGSFSISLNKGGRS